MNSENWMGSLGNPKFHDKESQFNDRIDRFLCPARNDKQDQSLDFCEGDSSEFDLEFKNLYVLESDTFAFNTMTALTMQTTNEDHLVDQYTCQLQENFDTFITQKATSAFNNHSNQAQWDQVQPQVAIQELKKEQIQQFQSSNIEMNQSQQIKGFSQQKKKREKGRPPKDEVKLFSNSKEKGMNPVIQKQVFRTFNKVLNNVQFKESCQNYPHFQPFLCKVKAVYNYSEVNKRKYQRSKIQYSAIANIQNQQLDESIQIVDTSSLSLLQQCCYKYTQIARQQFLQDRNLGFLFEFAEPFIVSSLKKSKNYMRCISMYNELLNLRREIINKSKNLENQQQTI